MLATLGSLFFSEVMDIVPCELCWYQRIFMYPLVFIFLAGMFPLDQRVIIYALPLAFIGWGISVYHWALYNGYIPDKLQPCGEGVSCKEVKLEILGFITIPMFSIMAFTLIIGLLFIYKRTSK